MEIGVKATAFLLAHHARTPLTIAVRVRDLSPPPGRHWIIRALIAASPAAASAAHFAPGSAHLAFAALQALPGSGFPSLPTTVNIQVPGRRRASFCLSLSFNGITVWPAIVRRTGSQRTTAFAASSGIATTTCPGTPACAGVRSPIAAASALRSPLFTPQYPPPLSLPFCHHNNRPVAVASPFRSGYGSRG